MERNELVLYLDIPEFSEALHASKWRTDIVLPQAGGQYMVRQKPVVGGKRSPCWRRFPPGRSGKT